MFHDSFRALYFHWLKNEHDNYPGIEGNQTPRMIFGGGAIKFGVSSVPADSCDYFGRHFKFDATTESGKNLLSILLAAKMANKNISIWYATSPTSGTNKDSGCTVSTLATVTQLGIVD